MTTNENTAIDKSKWGDGPWQTEPDRVEFRHAGLPCLLVRGPIGAWCGYAAVPPGHPWHGVDYAQEPASVDVHGGLTYADRCQGPICHVPDPGESDDVWWFGFDCAHYQDFAPSFNEFTSLMPHCRHTHRLDVYRDVAYVRAEVMRLAEQLAAQT